MPTIKKPLPTRFETEDPAEIGRCRRAYLDKEVITMFGRKALLSDFTITPRLSCSPDGREYIISRAAITLDYLP